MSPCLHLEELNTKSVIIISCLAGGGGGGVGGRGGGDGGEQTEQFHPNTV